MRPVRIRFTKTGDAKFISHLDLNRAMILALRRAKIPIWYTEGFNPHPYLTFALPLPVGTESICEVMDIRVEGDISDPEITARLSRELPEILKIISAAPPLKKASEASFARYDIEFQKQYTDAVTKLLSQNEIFAEKPLSKKRRKHGGPESEAVEIKCGMRDILILPETSRLSVTLAAGENSVSPKLIAAAISAYINEEFIPARIIRTEIFDGDLNIFE